MLRPAVWADVAHIPSTTFHYGEGQENVQFQLEEVVGEGTLALAPLPSSGGGGGAINGMAALDFHFGFDDISAPSLTPTSSLHFGGVPAMPTHHHSLSGDSLASFSGDDSDVSSTPSTPPPLSPVFKQENTLMHALPLPLHYGHLGYPSPSSESFSSGPSTPDHTYELDPVPGVAPLPPNHPSTVDGHHPHHAHLTPLSAYPITMPMAPSQNAAVIAPSVAASSSAATSNAASRSAKRRRGATGSNGGGTGSGSDDSTKQRMSWITAADAKLAAAAAAVAETNDDIDDDDDDDTDGDKKSGRRKGSGASNGGKQSKRERNKLSASKYRKRRKQYLDGLEGKCNELTSQLTAQTKKINALTTENKLLKENVAFLKNLLGYGKDAKVTKEASHTHSSHHGGHHDNFASHAGGGAAAATGVILFAFFACFVLFTPPWQPTQLGSPTSLNIINMPSSVTNNINVMEQPTGRLNRLLLQVPSCPPERNQTDNKECCLCPGDALYQIPSLPPAPCPSSPSSSSSSSSCIKEQPVALDSNGEPVVSSVDHTIASSSQLVNDIISLGSSSSVPTTAAAA